MINSGGSSTELREPLRDYEVGNSNVMYIVMAFGILVGVGLGVGAGLIISRDEDRQLSRKQEYLADAMQSSVELLMRMAEKDGATLAGQFIFKQSSYLAKREIFADYVEGLTGAFFSDYYQTVDYIPAIRHYERDVYESQMRTIYPEFEISEIIDAKLVRRRNNTIYYPTHFMHPPNYNLQGYDYGSSLVRLNAMETAIKSGKATASARLRLTDEQFGIAWFTPMIVNSMVKGFTVSVIKASDMFLSSIANATENDVVVHAFDSGSDEDPADHLLFTSSNPSWTHYNHATTPDLTKDAIWKDVFVGQRHWRLAVGVHPRLRKRIKTSAPVIVGIAVGTSISITWMLICFAYVVTKKERAELGREVEMARAILDSISKLQLRDAKAALERCSINPALKSHFHHITDYVSHFNAFLPDFKPLEAACRDRGSDNHGEHQSDYPATEFNPLTTDGMHMGTPSSDQDSSSSETANMSDCAMMGKPRATPTATGMQMGRITVVDICYETVVTEGRSAAVIINNFLNSMTEVCKQVRARITYAASTRATAVLKGSRPAESLFIANHLLRGFSQTYEKINCAIATGLASFGIVGGTAYRFYTYAGSLPFIVQNMLSFGIDNNLQILCNKAIASPSMPFVDVLYPNEEVYAVHPDLDVVIASRLIKEGQIKKADAYLKTTPKRDIDPYIAYYQKRYFSQKKADKKVLLRAVVINEYPNSLTNTLVRPVWQDINSEKKKKQIVYRKKKRQQPPVVDKDKTEDTSDAP